MTIINSIYQISSEHALKICVLLHR